VEKKKEKIDLGANAESYARKWLDTVGPAPAQRLAVESIEDDDDEEEDAE
jgi:hypothetical protein